MRYLFLFSIILFFSSCKIADFSTDVPEEDNSKKALAILEAAAKAHGTQNWENVSTYEVTFEDEFYGRIGKAASPFKGNPTQLKLRYMTGSPNSRASFLHEKMKGEVWSFNSEKGPSGSKQAAFWLPTYKYFIEFPARITEATVFRYVGEEKINGKTHEKVFATWNQVSAQKDFDQYLIWVDKESHLIGKVAYTIREANKWITGHAMFENIQDFGGILLPTEMPVGSNLLKEGKLLHKMSIRDVKFDSFEKEDLK